MLTINEINKLPFVFILGKGRSGTTLLQTILDANPNVVFPLESRLIIHLQKKYFHIKNWTSIIIDEFIIDLYTEKEFCRHWNLSKEHLRKQIFSFPIEQLTFSTLCKIVYLNYPSPFPKNKIMLIGNKKPLFSFFINDLIAIYPESKFIHLTRDYRDNIISSRKALGQKDIALSAQRWVMHNEMIEKFKAKHPDKFFTIRYEDIVSFPEKSISELCSFLEIPILKEMFDFHLKTAELYREKKSDNKIISDLINKIHLNLMSPINTDQIDKWKKELTINEIQIADHIAGPLGKKYNYNRVTDVWKFHYAIISIRTKLECKVNRGLSVTYYKLPVLIRKFIDSIIN